MKKNILVGILLLSVCASQAMNHKNKEEQIETQSLLVKYFPRARIIKKLILAGTFFGLFGGAKAFFFKTPTLKECTDKVLELKSQESRLISQAGNYYSSTFNIDKVIASRQAEKDRNRLEQKCVKQLNHKDRVTFFNQLDHKRQHEIFDDLSYTEARKLEKALKK